MIEDDLLVRDAVFRVGTVASVEGRRVRIAVDKAKNGSHLFYRGELVRNVSVGSYVKIVKGFAELIGKVDGERIQEDRAAPSDYRGPADRLSRTLDVSLVGFLEHGSFTRGVRELPLLDNECFVLGAEEFRAIHQFHRPDAASLEIGFVATEPTQQLRIGVDAIFASHIGVFGNTGSGKSYTLAKLYHEVFERFGDDDGFLRRSKLVLIDFNGEYVDVPAPAEHSTSVITRRERKKAYSLSTRTAEGGEKLPLPPEVIEDPAFWSVLLDATEKTQAPFVKRVLRSDWFEPFFADGDALVRLVGSLAFRATRPGGTTVDRQLPINLLEEIQACLNETAPGVLEDVIESFRTHLQFHSQQGKFYWHENGVPTYADEGWEAFIKGKFDAIDLGATALPAIDRVRLKLVLQYYQDVVSGFANREHLSPLIKRLASRVPDLKKLIQFGDADLPSEPLLVVSLKDVNLDMRKVLPMLVCKHFYDRKKADDLGDTTHLNLIIDEAHNILSTQSTRESDAWRDYRLETFEEIVKEGRKFGVFLTIASQRPHDISETIISQLHHYFLHRLVNNLDVLAVERAVAYLDAVSFESLPILARGSCVVAGVSIQVPVIVEVGELPAAAEPNSRTMSLTASWATQVA